MKRVWLLVALAVAFVALSMCTAPRPPVPQPPIEEPTLDMLELSSFNTGQVSYGGMYQFFDLPGTEPAEYQVGSHQVIPWYLLEPTEGNYDWSELDDYVADRASYGLDIGLGFDTVDYSPYLCNGAPGTQCWTSGGREDLILLPSDLLDESDQGTYYVVCPLNGSYQKHRLPKYWSSEYLTVYANFANALYAHIEDANLDDYIEPRLS